MRVNEIFLSINGEGPNTGLLAVFLRLAGCNVRCSYCDTKYAFYEGQDMSIDEVVQDLYMVGGCGEHVPRLTITGGEPLLQSDEVSELIDRLPGTDIEIETNGTIDFTPFIGRASLTVDWKCPSSGVMVSPAIENHWKDLTENDTVKFVIGENDLDFVKDVLSRMGNECRAHILLSAVYGETDPALIARWMVGNGIYDARLQLQIHKYIWPSDMRGV